MTKKMIIEALLHTLLPTYGNENVYHPDGSAIPVADLVESMKSETEAEPSQNSERK